LWQTVFTWRITMISLSSSCTKLVYVLVLLRALFWTLCSDRCMRRPNYGNRALLSERSVATRKSGGAEQWAGALQKNDGAERGVAEVTGLGWSVEWFFRPLTCSVCDMHPICFNQIYCCQQHLTHCWHEQAQAFTMYRILLVWLCEILLLLHCLWLCHSRNACYFMTNWSSVLSMSQSSLVDKSLRSNWTLVFSYLIAKKCVVLYSGPSMV